MMWGTYLKSWSTLWRTPRPRATSCPWCSIYYWSVMITWPGSTHSYIHSHILLPKFAQIMLLFSGTCLLMFFCYENNLALCLMKYKTSPPPQRMTEKLNFLVYFHSQHIGSYITRLKVNKSVFPGGQWKAASKRNKASKMPGKQRARGAFISAFLSFHERLPPFCTFLRFMFVF